MASAFDQDGPLEMHSYYVRFLPFLTSCEPNQDRYTARIEPHPDRTERSALRATTSSTAKATVTATEAVRLGGDGRCAPAAGTAAVGAVGERDLAEDQRHLTNPQLCPAAMGSWGRYISRAGVTRGSMG